MSTTYKVILEDEDVIIDCLDDLEAAFTAKALSNHLCQHLIDVIPMARKKKYFPNNWKAYKDLDEALIIRHPFDEVMELKSMISLDDTHYAVLRTRDLQTGKVKEKSYKSKRYALEALLNAVLSLKYEVTFLNDTDVSLFDPRVDVVDLNDIHD